YDEVVAYSYIYGIGLFSGLISLIGKKSWSKYWILCALAGLGALFRPTLIFYGFTTLPLAVISMVCENHSRLHAHASLYPGLMKITLQVFRNFRIWIGVVLFTAGLALLLFTNQVRFGSYFEFGHHVNFLPEA